MRDFNSLCHSSRTLLGALLLVINLCAMQTEAADRLVDPRHPKSTDLAAGLTTAPFKTLAAAMKNLQPGDHLWIAPGVYREPMFFPERQWAISNNTIIEGKTEGDNKVLIKGSQLVFGWKADVTRPGLYSVAWEKEPQQVFIEGVALKQIGGTIFNGYPEKPNHEMASLHREQGGIWLGRTPGDKSSMPTKSFWFDRQFKRLYVQCDCDSLDNRTIEVSVLPRLAYGKDLANITIKNLAFEHATTSTFGRAEAVTLNGNNIHVDSIDVRDTDSIGVGLRGENIFLTHSRIGRSGQLGLAAKGKHIHIVDNYLYGNNTRGFNKWWEAGGAKFVGEGGIADSEVTDNRVEDNLGDGIWFDWGPENNLVKSNVVLRNKGFGIHYEASFAGRIEENVVAKNEQRGIYLPQSSRSRVLRNIVADNGLVAIVVVDEGRRDPKGQLDLLPQGNYVCGNVIAWNKDGALIQPANIRDNRSDWNILIGKGHEVEFSLGWWPNPIRPVNLALKSWQERYFQDTNSIVITRVMDSAWISHLEKLDENWTVDNLMKELGLAPISDKNCQ